MSREGGWVMQHGHKRSHTVAPLKVYADIACVMAACPRIVQDTSITCGFLFWHTHNAKKDTENDKSRKGLLRSIFYFRTQIYSHPISSIRSSALPCIPAFPLLNVLLFFPFLLPFLLWSRYTKRPGTDKGSCTLSIYVFSNISYPIFCFGRILWKKERRSSDVPNILKFQTAPATSANLK